MAFPVARRRDRDTALTGMPREFEDIYDRMGELINTAFGDITDEGPWSPPADVFETDHAYVVECELPGAAKDEIDIELNDRELVVSGEIEERPEGEGGLRGRLLRRRRERRRGRFQYRVLLPGEIDPNAVTASLYGGVLTVVVPKAGNTDENHRIQITG
jgi:HSP20 family protein